MLAAEFQRLIGVRKSALANLPQRAKGKKHGTYAVQETVARSAIPKQSQAANGGPEAHRFLARNRRGRNYFPLDKNKPQDIEDMTPHEQWYGRTVI